MKQQVVQLSDPCKGITVGEISNRRVSLPNGKEATIRLLCVGRERFGDGHDQIVCDSIDPGRPEGPRLTVWRNRTRQRLPLHVGMRDSSSGTGCVRPSDRLYTGGVDLEFGRVEDAHVTVENRRKQ